MAAQRSRQKLCFAARRHVVFAQAFIGVVRDQRAQRVSLRLHLGRAPRVRYAAGAYPCNITHARPP